jgi:dTDP-4-dehydrorhamnose 3,5-epimerase
MFHDSHIEGVIWRPLKKYLDPRGWLCELYREDEIAAEFHPVMAYISMTEPGIARGPHEHVDQADYFAFIGPSHFKLHLWDNRQGSATHRAREIRVVGQDNPMAVIIPPGVVHAYQNVGGTQGIVFNCPNRLYKGQGRKEPVDEIRHEEDKGTSFRLE